MASMETAMRFLFNGRTQFEFIEFEFLKFELKRRSRRRALEKCEVSSVNPKMKRPTKAIQTAH